MHWEIVCSPNVIFEQDHEIHRIHWEIYGNLGTAPSNQRLVMTQTIYNIVNES